MMAYPPGWEPFAIVVALPCFALLSGAWTCYIEWHAPPRPHMPEAAERVPLGLSGGYLAAWLAGAVWRWLFR